MIEAFTDLMLYRKRPSCLLVGIIAIPSASMLITFEPLLLLQLILFAAQRAHSSWPGKGELGRRTPGHRGRCGAAMALTVLLRCDRFQVAGDCDHFCVCPCWGIRGGGHRECARGHNIDHEAWQVIVTTFQGRGIMAADGAVTPGVTPVTSLIRILVFAAQSRRGAVLWPRFPFLWPRLIRITASVDFS
jgi:hypothetical protein